MLVYKLPRVVVPGGQNINASNKIFIIIIIINWCSELMAPSGTLPVHASLSWAVAHKTSTCRIRSKGHPIQPHKQAMSHPHLSPAMGIQRTQLAPRRLHPAFPASIHADEIPWENSSTSLSVSQHGLSWAHRKLQGAALRPQVCSLKISHLTASNGRTKDTGGSQPFSSPLKL